MATSFYCDNDEPIASVLTRTLLETNQEIPDFLQPYVPEGGRENLRFEADSDFEEDVNGGGDADADSDAGGDDNATEAAADGDNGGADSGYGW